MTHLQKNDLSTVQANFCDVIECTIGVYKLYTPQK